MITGREKAELVQLIIAETSYIDKTYKQCEQNIDRWLKEVRKIDLPKDEKETLLYILRSRKENILILKEHYTREKHFRKATEA